MTHASTWLVACATGLTMIGMSAIGEKKGDADVDIMSERGEEVFNTVCVSCHTFHPPPTLAPPMGMVVQHYRDALTDEDLVVDAIKGWLRAPRRERSHMPAHAIERFGLMPPLPLPEADLTAVAEYVVDRQGRDAGTPGAECPMDCPAECPAVEDSTACPPCPHGRSHRERCGCRD